MIGQTIGHYTILEKLGQGGMGLVYKAQDTRLNRTVALKFLPGRLAGGAVERERLLREAQSASALNHPNVCTVYSIEEVEGEAFIVMEYVEGGNLAGRIASGGVPLTETVELIRQIAEALRDAHSREIVHRDIKPENIMITAGGRVKVMDFGLARLRGSEKVTLPGQTVGTLGYMAPELFQGIEADPRSDIFSLGVLLYEMLTGQKPFRGEHEAAMMYSIMNEEPPKPSSLRRDVPTRIDLLVRRALEKDPARRYQSMEGLLQDLRSPASATHPLVVHEKSIAVLPFENISPDRENDYFSDGLTEEIISSLSRIKTLKVVSRTSVMRFKGSTVPLRDIARELSVQYVLEGSVRKNAQDLRISAQLIDAADDSHIWAEKYRGTMEDIFDIQEKVAGEIAQALKVQLTADEHDQIKKRSTDDADAYEKYLKGRFYWGKRTEQGVRKGIEYFEEAARSDPSFALAQVGLADSYNILGFYSYAPPKEAFPRARDAARNALAIDDRLAEAHTSLGYVYHYFDWNWREAEREFRRAMELNPGYATAPQFYGNHLIAMGRWEEALAALRKARELEPLSLIINAAIAWGLYFARRYDESIAQFQRTLEMDDSFAVGHEWLGRALVQVHRETEAVGEFAKAYALTGGDPCIHAERAHALALTGNHDEATGILRDLESRRRGRYISPYHLAEVQLALGEKDSALLELERALEDRCREMVLINVEPRLDILRQEPRFTDLIRRVGL
jgi:serine/threonine protein kinase/Flp pilus assembly protein TadD